MASAPLRMSHEGEVSSRQEVLELICGQTEKRRCGHTGRSVEANQEAPNVPQMTRRGLVSEESGFKS